MEKLKDYIVPILNLRNIMAVHLILSLLNITLDLGHLCLIYSQAASKDHIAKLWSILKFKAVRQRLVICFCFIVRFLALFHP